MTGAAPAGRILLTGWFSFRHGEVITGDLLALESVSSALQAAGLCTTPPGARCSAPAACGWRKHVPDGTATWSSCAGRCTASRGRLWVACSEAYPQIKPGAEAERQDHRPRRHQGRRRRRQDDRLRRRPAHPDRRHAGRRRRLRRGQHGPASSLGHQGRRQGRQTRGDPVRLRHRGHAPHGPRPALGAGRAALLQPVGLHPQPHRDAARRPPPQRQRHLAVPAGDARAERLLPRPVEPVGHRLGPLRRRRSRPTAPAARASTTPSPAPPSPPPSASPRILQGLNPGSPKDCGLEILSGRHLPDDWQGNLITNDFRGHRVCRFVVDAGRARDIRRKRCRNSSRRTTRRSGRST